MCFNCALGNTWPFTPDLQQLPCGKANNLLWIGKAPLRSLLMTCARAVECAREWAPTLYSFPVCFPVGGFLTTLTAPPSSLVPWPSIKEADLLESTISNSKLDTGNFQKHTVWVGGLFPRLTMADLARPQCPCLGMVPLKCTQGMGSQKSFLLSRVKAPTGSHFHTESLLEKRNLALVRTFIILLSTSSANSSLRHGFQRKLNILFSSIYSPSELSLCIVNAHCREIDLSPSPR